MRTLALALALGISALVGGAPAVRAANTNCTSTLSGSIAGTNLMARFNINAVFYFRAPPLSSLPS